MGEALDRAPEIQVALEALAANAGSLAPTCRQLEEEGRPVSKDRLKKWARVEHPGMYREARIKQAERVKEFLADKHHAAAIRDLELEEEVTRRLEKRLKANELNQNAELALKGKAGLGSAIHTDKGQQLDADPVVQPSVNPVQIQINLERKGIRIAMPGEELEGEAEEPEDEFPS
jgi:hypothetical protein